VLIPRSIGFKVGTVRALSIGMTVVSALLVAAHFLRSGSYVLTVAGALFPALLVLRNRLGVRIVQLLLILAAAEWLWTLTLIALERQALGQPWIRMAFILGAVAALSIASALLLGRWFFRAVEAPGKRENRRPCA
jgi:hypothetical protein